MINNNWDKYLKEEYEKTYFKNLILFIENKYNN
ncbi:MAG TPA: uracil-DNA glycosylase, partial [Acholeplasmataceae bacterium]|nr:uracil-DNA glycosylase [Acholeplasmataceae bacterium]